MIEYIGLNKMIEYQTIFMNIVITLKSEEDII